MNVKILTKAYTQSILPSAPAGFFHQLGMTVIVEFHCLSIALQPNEYGHLAKIVPDQA